MCSTLFRSTKSVSKLYSSHPVLPQNKSPFLKSGCVESKTFATPYPLMGCIILNQKHTIKKRSVWKTINQGDEKLSFQLAQRSMIIYMSLYVFCLKTFFKKEDSGLQLITANCIKWMLTILKQKFTTNCHLYILYGKNGHIVFWIYVIGIWLCILLLLIMLGH